MKSYIRGTFSTNGNHKMEHVFFLVYDQYSKKIFYTKDVFKFENGFYNVHMLRKQTNRVFFSFF